MRTRVGDLCIHPSIPIVSFSTFLDKDKIIFLNKEDYAKPIDTKIATIEPEEEEGL